MKNLRKNVNHINQELVIYKNLLPFLENNFAMREEVEMLKEESLFQSEELQKYQRHCTSLADEVIFS